MLAAPKKLPVENNQTIPGVGRLSDTNGMVVKDPGGNIRWIIAETKNNNLGRSFGDRLSSKRSFIL
jgi:hypothetical protein